MNEYCAAMGLCNLRHVDEEIAKRKLVFEAYRELLDGIDGVRIPQDQKGVKRNYAYFPIFIDPVKFGATRDDVFKRLGNAGIRSRKYFSPAINDMKWYAKRFSGDTPIAQAASGSVLTLPLYADLSLNITEEICSQIVAVRK